MKRAADGSGPGFTPKQGQYLAFIRVYPRLYAGQRPPAGPDRHATVLPGHSTHGPPDAAHAGKGRAYLTPAQYGPEHRRPGGRRRLAHAQSRIRPNSQIYCARVLVGGERGASRGVASFGGVDGTRESGLSTGRAANACGLDCGGDRQGVWCRGRLGVTLTSMVRP